MDNITHSLIGIAAAEPLALIKPEHRVKLWVASAVANNLPDLDVLYTWGAHDRLTYMLHHRGYTHTLLLAPLQSLLWLAILRLWWRKEPASIPWRSVAALCFLGPLLHLFADSWNSYGVHPFWPFDNRWYYGDLVFIVEPWLWAIFLPPIWRRATTWPGKSAALLILAGMLGLVWYHPYVGWGVALALTLFTLLWWAAQFRLKSDRGRISLVFGFVALLFGVFGCSELAIKSQFAGEGSEIAASPAPGNPFCATVFAAGFRGAEYRAAAFTSAPWPRLVPASSCPDLSKMGGSTMLKASAEVPTPSRIPLGEFHGTRADFNELTKSCRVRAYLRFARIPFWEIEGKQFRLGDLRFSGGFRFSELSGAGEENCPRFEPPWVGRFYPGAF